MAARSKRRQRQTMTSYLRTCLLGCEWMQQRGMPHSTTAAHGLPYTFVRVRVQAHTEQACKEARGKAPARLAFIA